MQPRSTASKKWKWNWDDVNINGYNLFKVYLEFTKQPAIDINQIKFLIYGWKTYHHLNLSNGMLYS